MKLSEIIQSPLWFNELVRRWLALVIGFVTAIVVGFWIADQQMFKLAILAAVLLTIVVAVGMQRNAWLLILFTWSLSGSTYVIPIPLSIHDMAIILAACAYVTHHIVGGESSREPWGILKAFVAINFAWIVFTFVIHPVGLHAFGSEMMGARAYFNLALAMCSYWVIVHMPDSSKSVSRILLWLLAGTCFLGVLNMVVYIFPPLARYILPFYSQIDYSSLIQTTMTQDPVVKRFVQLDLSGMVLVQVLAAYYPPRTLFNPLRWRCYLFLLGLSAIFAAGFRNTLLIVLVSLTLSSWFHRGWRELALSGSVGILFFGLIILGQGRLYQLPQSTQRSLSFLPGEWTEAVKDDVASSSEDRFQWWRNIISEGAIKNWWVGDGFGVSENDYELLAFSHHTFEWFTQTGTFHNGPLSAIRYTGLIGLALFYSLSIAAAVYSVKCVRRCRGTPLLPLAIFLAMRLIWDPVHFTLVYGAYDSNLCELLLLVGLLCVTLRMSKQYPSPTALATEPIASQRFATAPGFALRSRSIGD
jgi:hypothetical protein